MRLWHTALFPCLPEKLRDVLYEDCMALKTTLLEGKRPDYRVGFTKEYGLSELTDYIFLLNEAEVSDGKLPYGIAFFVKDAKPTGNREPYREWFDDTYLKLCMDSLYEMFVAEYIESYDWTKLQFYYENLTGNRYNP